MKGRDIYSTDVWATYFDLCPPLYFGLVAPVNQAFSAGTVQGAGKPDIVGTKLMFLPNRRMDRAGSEYISAVVAII